MVSRISWATLFIYLSVSISVYYLSVLLLFYRSSLVAFFSKRPERLPRRQQSINSDIKTSVPTASPDIKENGLFSIVHELMEDLKEIFPPDLSNQTFHKDELMVAIHIKLTKYPRLKSTEFQLPVNNYIMEQSALVHKIVLTDEEVSVLW